MSKVRITSIIASPTSVICIDDQGKTHTVTNQGEINWLLDEGMRIFSSERDLNYYLEYDPENGRELYALRDCYGNELSVFRNAIGIGNTSYSIDTTVLGKFVDYAQAHSYDITPFLKKVVEALGPSTKDLLTFLEVQELPITSHGNILAFKVLERDSTGTLTDTHTKLISQDVGDVVAMPRAFVTADPNKHCACGLHVCSIDYAKTYLNRDCNELALVVVDPKDIVSVPSDCKSKVRCCKYQIVGLIPSNEVNAVLDENLENAPITQQLLDRCVLEQFSGVRRITELVAPTVQSVSDIQVRPIDNFQMEGQPLEIKLTSLVPDVESEQKSLLIGVLLWIKSVKQDPVFLSNKAKLKELKEVRKSFTWKELGIDDKLRKKIVRRMEKYGINS